MPSEEELMGLAAHMGMLRVLFQSKNSHDVIAFSHQHSSIGEADRDDWASQAEKKTKNPPANELQNKNFSCSWSICTFSLVLRRTYIPGAQI